MTEEDLTIVTTNDDGTKTFSVYLQDDIRNFEIFTETKRTEKDGKTTSLMGWTLCLCTSNSVPVLWLYQYQMMIPEVILVSVKLYVRLYVVADVTIPTYASLLF